MKLKMFRLVCSVDFNRKQQDLKMIKLIFLILFVLTIIDLSCGNEKKASPSTNENNKIISRTSKRSQEKQQNTVPKKTKNVTKENIKNGLKTKKIDTSKSITKKTKPSLTKSAKKRLNKIGGKRF